MNLPLDEISKAVSGTLQGPDTAVARGYSIDTRTLNPGDLFFAIKGPNFDGHNFVRQAFEKKASGVVVDAAFAGSLESSPEFGVIKVCSPTVALQALGQHVRRRWAKPIIGVTGSAGKTTTKAMVGAVLSRKLKVLHTIGSLNTAIGELTLANNTSGTNNIALGDAAGVNVTTASNVIAIGSAGADVSNSCFIGRIRGVTTAHADAVPVLIDSAGQLGTISSSRRFKKEIKPMDTASEAVLALKPVSFHYKSDNTQTPQFGLIAEDVADVNPDLIVRDENGEIYTVRYDAVNAMLLNEFLKEHRKNEQQETTIVELKSTVAQQQKQIEALTEGLQKVTAQLELSKPAPRTAENNQ